MSPKVSVLLPTFNYARFLPEAIGSVLSQRLTDFELLIVDNASTDGTREVVAPFLSDPRVRFRANPCNIGMVPNWNTCLAAARGEYVQFLFGDDVLSSEDALRRLSSVLDEEPDVSLVASARHVIDERSKRVDTLAGFPDGHREDGGRVILRLLPTQSNLIGEPSCVMFRRAQATRGFDTRYRQLVDLEMWFHLLESGRLAYVSEPLVSFRHHAGQESASNALSLAHVADAVVLLADYGSRHLALTPLQRSFHLYGLWYRTWCAARSGALDARIVRRRIASDYGLARFILGFLPYKLYKKLTKLRGALWDRG